MTSSLFLKKCPNCKCNFSTICRQILKGSFGSPAIIDYVILETVTLLNQRKIHSAIQSLMQFLRENKFTIFFITEQVFNEAIEMTIRSETDFLNLSDSSQIVVSKTLGVRKIATFDIILSAPRSSRSRSILK